MSCKQKEQICSDELMISFPKTNSKRPKNGWLGDDPFILGPGLFSGTMLVSGRVICPYHSQLR